MPLQDAPGEAEAREAIPDPKKPRTWDLLLPLVAAFIFMIGMIVFAFTEMKLNQAVCSYLFVSCQIIWGIGWVFIRPKRKRKYKDELRERRNLRDTVRGRRVSGRPWPGPQPLPWSSRRKREWDTRKGF